MGAIPGANQLGPGSSGVSWPVSDETFKVADNADATKIVEFELTGMTTANTIPITVGATAANPTFQVGTSFWTLRSAGVEAAVISNGIVGVGTGGFWAGATITGTDTSWIRHSAGVWRAGNDTANSIRGLVGGGAAVASAAALPLPTGRVFHVTGTTTVTSITSTNFESGAVITLIFDGVLTFTDGSNLVLAGNFVTTANDTITLVYDGTSWFETSRSVN